MDLPQTRNDPAAPAPCPGWAKGLFWGAVLFVYLFRMAYGVAFPWIYHTPVAGEYYYTVSAYEKGQGFEVRYMRSPAYPVFLLGVARTLGMEHLGMVQHTSLVMGVFLLGFLLTRIFPYVSGYMAAALFVLACGFLPSHFVLASCMMAESVQSQVLALVVLCMYLWLREPLARRAAILSVPVALALLLRPTNLVLLGAVVLVMAARRKKKAVVSMAVFTMVVFLCVLPWMLENTKLHGRFALVQTTAEPLIQTYGHLIDMQSAKNRPYKMALRDNYNAYMAARRNMTPDELVWAGKKATWGEFSFLKKIADTFHLEARQRDAVAIDLALEGIREHPWEVPALLFQKLMVFYFSNPLDLERAFNEFPQRIPLIKFSALDKAFTFGCERPWCETWDKNQQKSLVQKAGWVMAPVQRLVEPFAWGCLCVLWASIFFFPFALFGRHGLLGLFLFLFIHGYCVLVCLSMQPEYRYLEPVPFLAGFLLCLEALSAPEFFRKAGQVIPWTRPKIKTTP